MTPSPPAAPAQERGWRWLVLALFLVAFAVRVTGLQFQSLWRDEVDSIRFAGAPMRSVAALFASPGQNGPLYFLLLSPWLRAAGTSEFALRFFSVFPGALAVPLLFRLTTRLVGRVSVGAVAAALAATSPYLVWYSQEGKMYALVACVALVSTGWLLDSLEKGSWWRWLGYVVITGASLYLHIVAVLLIPAHVAMFTVLGGWRRRQARVGFAASLAALALAHAPLLAWQLPLMLHPGATGYRFVSLPAMLGSLMTTYSLGVIGTSGWLLVPSMVLLVVGAMSAGRGVYCRAARAGLVWLLVPVILLFCLTLVRPIYTARYLIFVLPAVWLLGALGACQIGARSRGLGGMCIAALLVANGYGLWLQARTPLKTDFRAATRYVAGRMGAGDLLLFEIPYGRYSFDYYFSPVAPRRSAENMTLGHSVYLPYVTGGSEAYQSVEGPYTNSGMSPEQVSGVMVGLLGDHRAVWYLESEAALWDERGLVKAWLDAHLKLTESAEFVRVAVYRYAVP